jgi:hypothetical protein
VRDDVNGSGCTVEKAGEDRVYSIKTADSRTFDLWLDMFSGSSMPDLAIYLKTDCNAAACVPEVENDKLGGPHRLLYYGAGHSILPRSGRSNESRRELHPPRQPRGNVL